MVHEFNTPEGQARLSRAMQADFEAAAERKQEQAEFEAHELQPWFDSLSIKQKDQLAEWLVNADCPTTLGLLNISYEHTHEMDDQEKFSL